MSGLPDTSRTEELAVYVFVVSSLRPNTPSTFALVLNAVSLCNHRWCTPKDSTTSTQSHPAANKEIDETACFRDSATFLNRMPFDKRHS